MTTILILFAMPFVAALVYLALQEGKYEVSRSLKINVPIEHAYRCIVDFKTWPKWSPWLLHEPEAPLNYSHNYQQVDGYYEWDGKLVGAGRLTHRELCENDSIEQDIEFRRPFKSKSRVSWKFQAVDGQTEVTWSMAGRMPFFLRFMTRMMKDMISRDYELGLLLLSGYLDPQGPHPKITFIGRQQLPPFDYLGRSFSGDVEHMAQEMNQGFPELRQQIAEAGIAEGKPCTLYFKADPVRGYFECDMAVPVGGTSKLDSGDLRHFAGGHYYQVQLEGDYEYLEHAWYKAYNHAQMLKLKVEKHRPSIEVYENDLESVDDRQQLLTSVYLPVT